MGWFLWFWFGVVFYLTSLVFVTSEWGCFGKFYILMFISGFLWFYQDVLWKFWVCGLIAL